MASKKEFPLSILVRTVDQSTGPLRRIEQSVQRMTRPVINLQNKLNMLGRNLGLPRLATGFSNLGREAGRVARKIGLIGAAAGLSATGIKSMIGEGDALAKLADRLGLSVDALSQLRFAAGQSGTEARKFDSALESLSKRLGEAKAGQGALYSYLKKSNPALLEQMKAAEGTEQAFMLLMGSIHSIEDPSEKAALASAAFGRSGQSIITMAAGGTEAIKKLREESFELTGSLEESARSSEKVADAFGRVSEATKGVKAALVAGLAPALLSISAKVKTFLVGNREAIATWAKNFGEKLPGYVKKFTNVLEDMVAFGEDVIEFLGGAKNAAILLAAILSKGLIVAVVELGIALTTTPLGLWTMGLAAVGYGVKKLIDVMGPLPIAIGLVSAAMMAMNIASKGNLMLVALAAIALAAKSIYDNWEDFDAFFRLLWGGVKSVFKGAWDFIKGIIDKIAAGVDKVIEKAKEVKEYFHPTVKRMPVSKGMLERIRKIGGLPLEDDGGKRRLVGSGYEAGNAMGPPALNPAAPIIGAGGQGGRGGDGANGKLEIVVSGETKGIRATLKEGFGIDLTTGYSGANY